MKTQYNNNVYFVPAQIHKYILKEETPVPKHEGFFFSNKGIPILLDHLITEYYINKKEFVNLSSIVLKKIMGNNYKKILNWLLHNEYIFENLHVDYGESKQYKINDEMIYDITCIVKNYTPKIKCNDWTNKYSKMIAHDLNKININLKDAKCILKEMKNNQTINLRKYHSSIIASTRIYYGDMYISYDPWGRIHTNLTNLKREIRQTCIHDEYGNSFLELDIPNSHPMMLLMLLQDNVVKGEYNLWKELCFNQEIYQYFYDVVDGKRKAKDLIYTVLYGRNKYNQLDEIFKSRFPSIHKFILAYKRKFKNYKVISTFLQEMEATFLYEKIYNTIKTKYGKDCILFTVHDSIGYREMDEEYVKAVFDNQIIKLKRKL